MEAGKTKPEVGSGNLENEIIKQSKIVPLGTKYL